MPSSTKMNIELDCVVLVQNIGIIGIEIKSTGSANSIAVAEKQLTGGKNFFTSLMSTISPQATTLPYVRVICVPNDTTPSPTAKTSNGSYLLNRDIIS